MIEFNGHISGAAEKRFNEKSRDLVQNAFLFAVLLLLPPIIFFCLRMRALQLLCGYCSLFVLVPILVRIPKSKKERLAMTPKRIYVEEECIVCISDQYTESKFICDVKKLSTMGSSMNFVSPSVILATNLFAKKAC